MNVKIIAVGFAGALALAATSANAALDDAKAQDLLKKSGCFACHSVDKKILGPTYKEVALKHKGESDAAGKLVKVVRNGSKGSYGSFAMPPNPASKISDEDLHNLLVWVLAQ
jgi:cytochrome c